MNAHEAEQADNALLRNARDAAAHYRNAENEARAALKRAEESAKAAHEKFTRLFLECEARAVARRKSGQIETKAGY